MTHNELAVSLPPSQRGDASKSLGSAGVPRR